MLWYIRVIVCTNCIWHSWNVVQKLGKEPGRVRNWTTNQNYPNYSINEIDQNNKKTPENLWRLVKDHQQTLV